MLASICLWLFHLFYHFATSITTFRKPFDRHTSQPLNAKRAKIPSHLALLLVANNIADREAVEATLVESVLKAVKWCRVVGIKQLTVYDADGVVAACSQEICDRLIEDELPCDEDSDSELVYPLTPPLSEASESRPRSPEFGVQLGVTTYEVSELRSHKTSLSRKRTNVLRQRKQKIESEPVIPLTLNFISRQSSKPAIASVARSYARTATRVSGKRKESAPTILFELSSEELGSILEGQNGLLPPDFMILHHIAPSQSHQIPIELYGFPPWQIQLTEIYLTGSSVPKWHWFKSPPTICLQEEDFRGGLDEFSGAEMRLGK